MISAYRKFQRYIPLLADGLINNNRMVKGETGEKCKFSGKYYCEAHHDIVITIMKTEVFPKCGYIHNVHDAIWVLYLQY